MAAASTQPKPNYQRMLEQILAQTDSNNPPTLFLHACCAPCSSYVLAYLSHYFRITLFFYNPNIAPEAEYLHRLAELQRLITQLPLEHPVSIVNGEYVPQRFFELAKGLEQEPERGLRCQNALPTDWKQPFGRQSYSKQIMSPRHFPSVHIKMHRLSIQPVLN